MKVTLKEVAKKSGMSVTTVSRALNGFDDVAADTRAIIEATAAELGYTPNLNARRLKTQRADTLGLILSSDHPRFSDPFFGELFSGLIEQCAVHGLEFNVTTLKTTENFADVYQNYIRSRRVDGFVLLRLEREDPRIPLLQKHDFPFVAFGRTDTSNDFAFVDEDGAQAIEQMVDHLVALGHTRIAYLGEPDKLYKSHQRSLGYRHGLANNQLPYDPALMFEGNFRQRSGEAGARHLLSLDHPPTAIIAANDLMAIGAMRGAQGMGLTVGKDISITGFDDILLSELLTPSLTTLHQPAFEIGALLCKHLVTVINGEATAPPQTVLQPTLVTRDSTGPVC